jgi:hypothetical protein
MLKNKYLFLKSVHNVIIINNMTTTTRQYGNKELRPLAQVKYTESHTHIIEESRCERQIRREHQESVDQDDIIIVSQEPRVPCLPTPLEKMSYDEIETFLRSKIKEQDAAIRTITDQLFIIRNTKKSLYGENKPLLYKMTFSGTSGCGKTETVLWIKHLLGMDTGYIYEHQYIEIDGSLMIDDTQINALTGAAPGLIGHGDANSLGHRLNMALRMESEEEEETAIRSRKNNNNNKKSNNNNDKRLEQLRVLRRKEKGSPRYILLFLDEVDKASPLLMASINGLIDTGHYATLHGPPFKLPRETALIVIFTANYAAEEIRALPYRNTHQAVGLVETSMKNGFLKDNNIERMGQIVIFYSLDKEAMKRLLMSRLDQYIAESDMARQYGESRVQSVGDVKDFLIERVLAMSDSGRGVRNGMRKLFENINVLFQRALAELRRIVEQEKQEIGPNDKIILSRKEFDAEEVDIDPEQACKHIVNDIIMSLLKDPHCRDMLPYHRETGQKIDAMSMHFGERHLVTTPFACVTVNIHHNTIFNGCKLGVDIKKHNRLREKFRAQQGTLDEIETVVEAAEEKRAKDPFYNRVKQIMAKHKTDDEDDYDDDDDEDDDEEDDDEEQAMLLANKVKSRLLPQMTDSFFSRMLGGGGDDQGFCPDYETSDETTDLGTTTTDDDDEADYDDEDDDEEEEDEDIDETIGTEDSTYDEEAEVAEMKRLERRGRLKRKREEEQEEAEIQPDEYLTTTRKCIQCKSEKELRFFYAYRGPNGIAHYRTYCNACRKKKCKK